MIIEQFFDKGLAHLSYLIISKNKAAVIDPSRDPKPYFEFAERNKAEIVAVIETHPHADFVSSHMEISNSGAKIYTSKLTEASYPHTSFDDGDMIALGEIKLKALSTPGHSPDSISIVLEDESGKDYAVFTGDTLFIGDVGRPDLRENAGNTTAKKEMLARQMYYSLRDKLMHLPDNTIVYPAHGAGSLCGKSMSQELSGTIRQQKMENYALQKMDEDQFVNMLLENQPFVPKYFPYDVELNRKGAPSLLESIKKIPTITDEKEIEANYLIVDARPQEEYKAGHLKGALNIQNALKFETWLGSIVSPDEQFYLIASNENDLSELVFKASKIGYERNIKAVLAKKSFSGIKEESLDLKDFTDNPSRYTIVDIRDNGEVKSGKIFKDSIHIPLSQLRERKKEIPAGKPIVVHCAGGYRSAAGASILKDDLKDKVYDLSDNIKKFTSH